nr:hypothetical protein B0A51_07850 [Rachicladosporium sp. CCFEE 5018]
MPPTTRSRAAQSTARLLPGQGDASSNDATFLTNDTTWAKRKRVPNEPQSIPTFAIDLSLPPEQRYTEVCAAFKDEMLGLRELFDDVVGSMLPFLPSTLLKRICWLLLRGVYDAEETAELKCAEYNYRKLLQQQEGQASPGLTAKAPNATFVKLPSVDDIVDLVQIFGGAAENVTTTYAFGEDDGASQLGFYQPNTGLRRRAGLKPPIALTASELTAQASKGCNLLYMMAASADDALIRMQRNPASKGLLSSQSIFTNAGDLKTRGGWSDKKPGMTLANWAYAGIPKIVEELKIKTTDDKANLNVQLTQDQQVNGYAISKGTYNQFMNIQLGLVIPYYIYSPQHEMKVNSKQGKAVDLSRYSDVLFLYWKKLCGRTTTSVCPLKYFLFLNIENQQTWATVLNVLGSKKLTEWPGVMFDMNSDEGKALLATQIGNPLAWFLIQHKAALGTQIVTKVLFVARLIFSMAAKATQVRVFKNTGATSRDTDTPYPNLFFYTGDAPKDNHCGPSDSCCCPKV